MQPNAASKAHPKAPSALSRRIFSHAEALVIAGISAEALLTWHRRGFAPETPGRRAQQGNRRAYSTLDVIVIALVKRLADAGCALSEAQELAGTLLGAATARIWSRGPRRPGEEYLMLVRPRVSDFVSAASLLEWMRKRQPKQVTLIDFGAFAGEVSARYRDTLDLKIRNLNQRAMARRSEELEERENETLAVQATIEGLEAAEE